MALAISHEDTQILLKDKNVLQESVLNKYRTAGQIAQTALKYVTSLINDSYHTKTAQRQLTVSELCLLTDSFVLTRLEQHYKNKVNERGIAIPTTIDIDQISGGWSPEIDDTQNLLNWNKNKDSTFASSVTGILRAGDLVKITLGVHIDGYTSEVSHTMVIYPVDETKPTPQPTGPLLGGKADAVAAAHIAMETVVALLACALTPEKLPASLGGASKGITGQVIRTIVDTIARSYNCGIVPGSRVRRIRRFLAGQNEGIVAEKEYKGVIWAESHQEAELLSNTDAKDLAVVDRGQSTPFTNASAIPSDDFVVQSGEVYLIDLKMASLEHCSKKGLVTLETVDSYVGKSHKEGELIARPGIYVRDFAQVHILKLKTARQLLTKIDRQGVYPLKLSHLSSNFPFVDESEEELQNLKKDLRSFRLGMSEISNNYLCVESPIQIARWIPWDHILKATNSNGNLSYDATTTLTLPGHELPLPKLGVSAIKLKSLLNSTNESISLPVARECNTVVLCDSSVSTTDRPELLRLTGGSKTCQPSWIHSQRELNPEDSIVQGIFQLATLAKDKRFGLLLKETQPMKQKSVVTSNIEVEETMKM